MSYVYTQLFMGKLYECSDTAVSRRARCVGNYTSLTTGGEGGEEELVPREWQRAFYNFDNTPWSFVTLFVVATREGWPSVLWSTIDSGEFEVRKLSPQPQP
jgi:hypothetical protein